MGDLPEKFPEYSIMFRTISNQIKSLEKQKQDANDNKKNEIESKIQQYKTELEKIKKMFPEKFFESDYS